MTTTRKLILMSGVMGSGKTTEREYLARTFLEMAGESPIILHPDDTHMKDGRYCYTEAGRDRAWDSCYRQLAVWATSGRGPGLCIFDGTWLDPTVRKAVVSIAHGLGVEVEIFFLDTPLQLCLARNATRSQDRRIPDQVIAGAFANLKAPSPAEGFDRVVYVRTWLNHGEQVGPDRLEVFLSKSGQLLYKGIE